MDKYIQFREFMGYLMDDGDLAEKGGRIVKAVLESRRA
jgi:hypothetical protein